MSAPIEPCPTCGVPTKGTLIVGRVYDHGCDACADQMQGDFLAFVDLVASGELDAELAEFADDVDADQ